jgi:hypothetical protein
VPSRFRTEPMRRRCRSRVCRGLDSAANAPGQSALPFGDRACRFAWPARGTERILGRNVSQFPPKEGVKRQCRCCLGTDNGLTPYSCLVPPRYFPLVEKTPIEWTPSLEPSRRRTSQASCRSKQNRLQRLRRAKRNATVELEGTSLNLQGPDNGSLQRYLCTTLKPKPIHRTSWRTGAGEYSTTDSRRMAT